MRVFWTRAALGGLEDAADYIARDSPAAALRLVDHIVARTNALLAEHPMCGRQGRVSGTRELVLAGTPYVVAYRVGKHIDVLAVQHGAREWPTMFRTS